MNSVLVELEKHVVAHRLVERAREGFAQWLSEEPGQGQVDLPSHWTRGELGLGRLNVSLCFRSERTGYPYVDTRFEILRAGDEVGHYRLITSTDGSDVDDYFVIDETGG